MSANGHGSPNGSTPDGKLTTAAGAPVADNNNVMTAGPRGPMLMQDVWYQEKLAHFDREVIPERRMHAKGSGAYGTFTVTNDITRYTRASIFSEIGKQTEMFARFSVVAGERGAADAVRDIRGFATKFYTDEGNWDIVGNNTPVFFHADPLKFPDLNHVVKRDPRTNMASPANNWDWWSLLPESLHQVTITMSERGIPASYRHMHGYGSHTFSLINADGQRHWVKFHHRVQQGIKNLTDAEASAVRGQDLDSNQRDLLEAIDRGEFPRWKFYVQVMPEADAATLPYQPVQPDQGVAAGRLPAHRGRTVGTQPQPGELLRRGRAGRVRAVAGGARDRLLPGQDAARAAVLLPRRPVLPARRQPSDRSRSTRRAARCTAITATAPCGSTATTAPPCTTSPTVTASGRNSPPTARHRNRSATWPPATGTSARTTTTTTPSPASCSRR